MNKVDIIFKCVVMTAIIFLSYVSYQTKRIAIENRSIGMEVIRMANETSLVVQSSMETASSEMEFIAREVAREEVLATFKQFGENFRKLSDEEQSLQPTKD